MASANSFHAWLKPWKLVMKSFMWCSSMPILTKKFPGSSRLGMRKTASATGVPRRAAPQSFFSHPKSSAPKGNFNQSVTMVSSLMEGKNLSEEFSRASTYSLMYSLATESFAAWILRMVPSRVSSIRSFAIQETEARMNALPVKSSPRGGWSRLREFTGNCRHMFVFGSRERALTLAWISLN